MGCRGRVGILSLFFYVAVIKRGRDTEMVMEGKKKRLRRRRRWEEAKE